MAHGLGSTRDMRIDAFAAAFSEAGFACFLFDYRNNGDSKGDRRYRINVKEQLEDWNNAVKFVSTLEQVDSNRIYLFGTSFSGGHVMTLAAKNAAVKGVVAQCPYTDTFASVFAVPFVTRTKLLFTLFADCFTRLFGHRIFVPLAGQPGSTALMVSQDYEVYLNLMTKHSKTLKKYNAYHDGIGIFQISTGQICQRHSRADILCGMRKRRGRSGKENLTIHKTHA